MTDIDYKMDGIESLDVDTPDYIYVYHEQFPQMKRKIIVGANISNITSAVSGFISGIVNNDSTIINNEEGICLRNVQSYTTNIKNITKDEEFEAFTFTMNYLEKYADVAEWEGLKKPATEANVKYWLDDTAESTLFGQYRDINVGSDVSRLLIRKLSIALLLANYLGMNGMVNKCCYLIAYAIAGKTPDQIEKVMSF